MFLGLSIRLCVYASICMCVLAGAFSSQLAVDS